MFDSPSISILEKEIISPDQQCARFNQDLALLEIFAEGGGSYLIKAISKRAIRPLGIKEGQYVAIKLCKGDILDVVGCNEYVKEANLMRKITLLHAKGICYNFPIYYMYGKCCLFYRSGQYDDISDRLPLECDLPYDKDLYRIYGLKEAVVPDLLIHYANTDMPPNTVLKTEANYGKPCLYKIKSLFQLDNFSLVGEKWDIDMDQPDIDKAEIYNFIVGDSDVNCGNYIVMSIIEGSSLDKLNHPSHSNHPSHPSHSSHPSNEGQYYKFGMDLFFEMMYSNACLIKHYGFVLSDRHDDNVVIGDIDIPRVYKLGNKYLMFNTSTMYYSIDLQATTNKQFRTVRDLVTVGPNHLTTDILDLMTSLEKDNYTLDQFMINILPIIYQNYIISAADVYRIMERDPRIKVAEYK